ncbi:RNA polymerase-associated protein rtf1 [Dissophora globulifera]|uniref:RNA polymerase-associated protein rtf1 n=1 Tax=Dissophora globulifera TaxID=979702 RepID=A0A9P6V0W0_9FUNG|nr:RNA polymerase-associated protein rtf1 [Dissophora globulifera]
MSAADVILRLLATSTSDSNKGRRRRRSRQSSDEEISEAEMSDRSDDQDEDDEDDEGPVDEYDADFFGDAKDRAELMAKSEMEREQILFERAKNRERLLDHRQVAKRLKRQEETNRNSRKSSSSTNRDSARRSTRAKDSKTGSTKALADLKRAQERKRARRSHSPEAKRRRKGSPDYSDKSETPSSEEEADYDSEPGKKKSSKSITRKPATLEDLNAIRLSRDRLEKWCYSPFFKDTAVGCFVRLSLGTDPNRQPVYRITEIISVGKQSKIYQVGKTMTNQTLTLKHGKAEKVFTMENISNGNFTEDEFRRYETVLRTEKLDIVTHDHVENKRKDIDHAKEYVLSDKEVEEIIELKKLMKQGRLNPIVHRTILEQQKMSQSHEEAEETERRLQELRESELAQRDLRSDKLDIWAKLNEKNRILNRSSGREAEGKQAMAKKQKGSTTRDVDPFARRKTTPRIFYDNMSVPGTPSENADSGASTPAAGSPAIVLPTPTVQSVAAAPAMPQSRLEEVIASNKDEFDIEVDLDDL